MLRELYIFCHDFCHTFRWCENEGRAEVYIFVMTSVILSGDMKMRVEHGMLREVYIFCHDFCHTLRSNMECLGRYTFALGFFFAASFTASFAAFREALSFAASFAAFRQLLCHTLCAQKQIDKNTCGFIKIRRPLRGHQAVEGKGF